MKYIWCSSLSQLSCVTQLSKCTEGMMYSPGTSTTVVKGPRQPKHSSVSVAAYVNDSKDF